MHKRNAGKAQSVALIYKRSMALLRDRKPSEGIFRAHAIDFAKSVEGLILIDGNRLVNLMMDNEVGVNSQAIKLPKLDIDYFD
ncbi:EcoKMrr [Proteus mirabilis]|uniref:EcoKMrr n=1 Tax=Proteus mirabilis TaxID=584 RepID=A0A379FEU8_PROMI|nr:EcoKMrr [Proteus mirabilis]